MKRLFLSAICLAAAPPAAVSQTESYAKVVFVEPTIQPREKVSGAAFTVAHASGECVLLSAGHVTRTSMSPALRVQDERQTYEVEIAVDSELADVLITKQLRADYFGGCPGLPTRAQVEQLLRKSIFEVETASETGALSRVQVVIERIENATLTIKALSPNQQLSRSMSGSPVMTDGKVVAILQAVGDFNATALRIDALPGDIRDALSSSTATGQPPPPPPFDLESLPAEIKNLARKGREVRALAESAAVQARKAADQARQSSQSAESISGEGVVQNNVSRFLTQTGNYYSGGVTSDNNLISSQGFGLLEIRKGDNFGNRFLCGWKKNEGCEGVGVFEYAQNVSNTGKWKSWEGQTKGTIPTGYGILTFNDGSESFWNRQYDRKNHVIMAPGTWVEADGRIFEGDMANSWVKGVLWSSEGRLICHGYWMPKTDGIGVEPDVVKNKASGFGCRN